MASSVVKSDQTVQQRMFQEFSGIPNAVRYESGLSISNVIGQSGHSFFPTEHWGEPSRLDTDAVLESALQILGSTVVSKSEPASDPWESPRHLEAAAVMDRLARGLLWKISDCAFISGPEVVDLADDYDGLRAVLRVVRAGWATAAPDGLLVTDHGRDVARRMFVDR